eukprot:3082490-Rhodomonas_salina.1
MAPELQVRPLENFEGIFENGILVSQKKRLELLGYGDSCMCTEEGYGDSCYGTEGGECTEGAGVVLRGCIGYSTGGRKGNSTEGACRV